MTMDQPPASRHLAYSRYMGHALPWRGKAEDGMVLQGGSFGKMMDALASSLTPTRSNLFALTGSARKAARKAAPRMKVPIRWPNPEDERKEARPGPEGAAGRGRARDLGLRDLGFEVFQGEVVCELDLEVKEVPCSGDGDEDTLLDVMQVLVLTDLELSFWPPAASREEACCALRQLHTSARRRAVLAAQRVLSSESVPATVFLAKGAVLHSGAVPRKSRGVWELPVSDVKKHPALRAAEFVERGLGLIVEEELQPGEELLRVPEEMLLNIYTALQSEHFGSAAKKLLQSGLHVETVTMLFALTEKRSHEARQARRSSRRICCLCLGPSRRWKHSARSWLLLCRRRCSLSGSSRGRCVVAWAPCRRRSAAASDVCTSTTSCGRGASLIVARCRWSCRRPGRRAPEPIPSRVVCLAPEVDLLNHSPWGVCAPPFFDQQRRELVVKLLGQAAVGQEVCLSYGPLQTWEMLFYYGFCPVENPHDRMVVKVDLPEDEATSEREVILRLQGIPTEVALRPPVEVGCGWCSLGALCPQLLRCFRVLLGDIETLDLDAAPGEGTSDLDLQCLTAIEELLQGLLQPLREGPEEAERSWWHLYGARIEAFRQSQRTLLEGNLQQLNALRRRLQGENKKPRMEDALAAQKKRCPAAGDAGIVDQ
ncbi:unnamed protein product [Durusdinium trenchii]|uniref:SET domain-containing protein n=1 Tax=Durusdinium trenchii TaxID=1381693 RepID=A0ABP0T1Y7_9DINO